VKAVKSEGAKKALVNVCRVVLALTFIFSGFVKAIDPLGTQYKLNDYLGALHLGAYVPQLLTLVASVLLAALEFGIGIFLLFAIHRRTTSKVALLLMVLMTAVTLWLAVANPISDCGCFGDALVLSNWQTFGKNVVLLACAAVICRWPLLMPRLISLTNQWIVINFTFVFILISSIWCLYDLPLFDFRPYHVGANIKEGMEIPEGAKQPKFETTFILEKDGERREFTLDDYPDSTWTFIDSKSVQTEAGYVPPIHDFNIVRTEDGEDITEEVLSREGYTFLLVSPHLEQASDRNFGSIDQLYEYCQEQGYPFYCLTASNEEAIQHWRDITGAEYPFCQTDETTLKTIIRSNPGLLLLKQGTIIRKWSHNNLPQIEAERPLEQLSIGQLPENSVPGKILKIVLWFVLPLFVLTVADRLLAWTRWLRRKPRHQEKENITLTHHKKEEENEKENCSR
jgi:triosephosphate isomerase